MLAHVGELVFRRARWVLVVAALLVAVAGVLGAGAFGKLKGSGGFQDPSAESTQAASLIKAHSGGGPNLVFLVHARQGTVDSPAARTAAVDLVSSLTAQGGVRDVQSYWTTNSPAMRSHDGRDAVVLARIAGPDAQLDTTAATVIRRYVTPSGGDASPIFVRAGGGYAVGIDTNDQVSSSLARAELIAVPITLILLVLAFGSFVAAAVPLVIGGVAIAGTFAELDILGSTTDVSVFAINLTTALGLALGIDYALFMVGRFREQLAAGDDVHTAVVHTVRTAGRTIVFSAGTVAVALAALLIFPMYFLRSFAYAGIGVVVIAALAALVITPAMLTLLGRRINAARLPWSKADRGAASPFWGRLATAAMRRPLLSAVPVVAVLLLAASPLLHVAFGTPDEHVLSTAAPSRQVADTIHAELGGASTASIEVVTTGSVDDQGLGDYAQRLSQVPGIERVTSGATTYTHGAVALSSARVSTGPQADVHQLSAAIGVDAYTGAAQDIVGAVRAVPTPAGVRALVGGTTAELVDTKASIGSRLPAVGLWIVLTTFVLLFLFTGSIVQPLRALLVNGLSIVATLGAMTWIFYDGHLASALGFTPRPMDTAVTVLLFCITFGLCMDYEVFVTSRIRELHVDGHDARTSVGQGLARTGRIISMAAGLMAVNFFAFGTSSVSFLQMFGLGAGLAVLIDATLVRGILVPAVMRLAGPVIWYSPKALRRLHDRVGLRES